LLIEHPEKVAIPPVAVTGLEVQLRVPLPGLFQMVSRIWSVVETTTSLEFSTDTTGWGLSALPGFPLPGCVVKARCVAVVTVTLGELARSVKVPPEVDFSKVMKVEVCDEPGAVAPGPEVAFEP
jgi:hypothetical protein